MADKGFERTKYFVLAFATAFLVLALFAMWAVKGLQKRPGGIPSQTQGQASADDYYIPRAQDNLNVLVSVREDADEPAHSFFLVRLDAGEGSLPVAGLPPQTVVRYAGKNMTLVQLLDQSGVKAVQQALGELLGITVDRYAAFTAESLVQAVDIIGFVEYHLPRRLEYHGGGLDISLEAGRQMVDGVTFRDLLLYPGYGDDARRTMAGAELAAFYINGRLQTVLSPKADTLFRAVVNLIDTDISYADYDSRREVLSFLAKLSGDHARAVLVRGTFGEGGDTFVLAQGTGESLHRLYRGAESGAAGGE